MVSEIAIPRGDLTKWCVYRENREMTSEREKWTAIRRQNLRTYVDLYCGGNIAEFIRLLPQDSGNEAYWRSVLGKSKKSFSMEKAAEIEPHLGLYQGELQKEGSQLVKDPARSKSARSDVLAMIDKMEPHEHLEMVNFGVRLMRKRAETKEQTEKEAPKPRRA